MYSNCLTQINILVFQKPVTLNLEHTQNIKFKKVIHTYIERFHQFERTLFQSLLDLF